MEFENAIFQAWKVIEIQCIACAVPESRGICFWMPFLSTRSCDFEEKSFVEFDEIDYVIT